MLRFVKHLRPCGPLNCRVAFYSPSAHAVDVEFIKDNAPRRLGAKELLPVAKYGGESTVTLLTGSTSIGKQGASFIRSLFETAKVPVFFERIVIDPRDKKWGQEYLQSVMRNRTAIHVDLQYNPEDKHKSLLLNCHLDLYACIIQLHSFEGFNCKFPDLDITLIIQNNSGDFSKLEYEPVSGLIETLRFCDDLQTRRFMRHAFQHAQDHGRKRITLGHKMREMPLSDGHFIEIAREVQCCEYPDIEIEEMEINRIARMLVMQPNHFDMICTSDRYGTFLTSICAAVCGGASLFSVCERGDHHAVFKPLQTKLSLTDCRLLSPYGIVRACVDLLKYLGNCECAHTLWDELLRTMIERNVKTEEFGGKDKGDYVICDIVNNLECKFTDFSDQ